MTENKKNKRNSNLVFREKKLSSSIRETWMEEKLSHGKFFFSWIETEREKKIKIKWKMEKGKRGYRRRRGK